MKILLIILFIIAIYLLIFSLCKASSKESRHEEMWKNKHNKD
nr:MAG TPA: protein of unknown function (DUF5016) [Caudoviricetes sp.]